MMDFPSLIALSFVCAMGAMSPGPSLAVVLRNTISGGRLQGVMTGIGHGFGFGIYALLAITGLSALLLAHDSIFLLLQWSGALVLLWLSFSVPISCPFSFRLNVPFRFPFSCPLVSVDPAKWKFACVIFN